MKMSKKFATTVVAAVMAAAMLTACGGAGNPSAGDVNIKNEINNTVVTPGNSGESSASSSTNSGAASSGSTAEKPGSDSSASSSGSSSESVASSTPAEPDKDKQENPLPANPQSWADSWTKAMYAKRGAADNDLFVIGRMNCHNTHLSEDVVYTFTYAASGTKSYAKLQIDGLSAQFYADETGYYEYEADPNTSEKSYQKASGTQEDTLRTQLVTMRAVYRVPTTANVTSWTGADVNGKWVETITLKDGSSYVYTYSKEDGTIQSLVSKFGDYIFTTDPIDITSYTQARYAFSFPTVNAQQ